MPSTSCHRGQNLLGVCHTDKRMKSAYMRTTCWHDLAEIYPRTTLLSLRKHSGKPILASAAECFNSVYLGTALLIFWQTNFWQKMWNYRWNPPTIPFISWNMVDRHCMGSWQGFAGSRRYGMVMPDKISIVGGQMVLIVNTSKCVACAMNWRSKKLVRSDELAWWGSAHCGDNNRRNRLE